MTFERIARTFERIDRTFKRIDRTFERIDRTFERVNMTFESSYYNWVRECNEFVHPLEQYSSYIVVIN